MSIIGKMVYTAIHPDLEVQFGTDQLCAKNRCTIEGAVHAMCGLFAEYQSHSGWGYWGILLVDATNAFNSLNRVVLLWNARISVYGPHAYIFCLIPTRVVLRGTNKLLFSRKGVTKGNPLSMFLYAVGTLSLIHLPKNPEQ